MAKRSGADCQSSMTRSHVVKLVDGKLFGASVVVHGTSYSTGNLCKARIFVSLDFSENDTLSDDFVLELLSEDDCVPVTASYMTGVTAPEEDSVTLHSVESTLSLKKYTYSTSSAVRRTV